MVASSTRPTAVRQTAPEPPNIEVPPMMTTVIASKVIDEPVDGVPLVSSAAKMTPPTPPAAPTITNVSALVRLTRSPARRAETSPPPTAYSARPNTDLASTKAPIRYSAATRTTMVRTPNTELSPRLLNDELVTNTDREPVYSSARPVNTEPVASVATKALMRNAVTRSPFTAPASAPTTIVTTTATGVGVSFANTAATTEQAPTRGPDDRSKP